MHSRTIRLIPILIALMLALPLAAARPVSIAAQDANCDGLDAYISSLQTAVDQLATTFPESSEDDLENWTGEEFTMASDATDALVTELDAIEPPAIAETFHGLLIQQFELASTMFDTMATTGIFGAFIYVEQMDALEGQMDTAVQEIETACGIDLDEVLEESGTAMAATPVTVPLAPAGSQDDRGDGTRTSGDTGTRAYPIPMGQTVAISDDWELTILSVTPDATDQILAESSYNDPPPPGQQFFVATVRITYTGDDSDTFYGWGLRTVGKSAVSYSQSVDDCGMVPDELESRELFTGGTIEGNLCWSIDSSDADSMVLYDGDQDSDERIFFSLMPSDAIATPVSR
jgi:hypothetical protein